MGWKVPSAEAGAPPVGHHLCPVLCWELIGRLQGSPFLLCSRWLVYLSCCPWQTQPWGSALGQVGRLEVVGKGLLQPPGRCPPVLLRSLGVSGVPVGRDESLCDPVQAVGCSLCLGLLSLVHGHPCPCRGAGGSCIAGAGQGMLFPREKNQYFQNLPLHTENWWSLPCKRAREKVQSQISKT